MFDTRILPAAEMIRASSGRITSVRARVLTVLLGAERALTHQEIAQRLDPQGVVDRVTLYRTLEWLVDNKLAHRVSGGDRAWRFNASGGAETHEHAHFTCTQCDQVYCLDEITTAFAIQLPKGFQSRHIELSIKGVCNACAHRDR
ncbi:Fur family transcriptional regulator [Sulfuriferula sp. GW1]|uniref:Fur family transcriptional regulator n=1 Tax=Sulfuriferula sp. GW1 TaxID=3345111 RepID=UPI0039AEF4C4